VAEENRSNGKELDRTEFIAQWAVDFARYVLPACLIAALATAWGTVRHWDPLWVGIAAITVFVLAQLVITELARWNGRAEPTKERGSQLSYLPRSDVELNLALRLLAQRSAWGRWYAARILALHKSKIEEEDLMLTASGQVTSAAANGRLTIRGRRLGGRSYEPIPKEYWGSAFLDVRADPISLWQVFISPGDYSAGNTLQFDSLIVSAKEIETLWPKHEGSSDEARKEFLEQARQEGLDPAEIARLSAA